LCLCQGGEALGQKKAGNAYSDSLYFHSASNTQVKFLPGTSRICFQGQSRSFSKS
jgi:hypothetical protein